VVSVFWLKRKTGSFQSPWKPWLPIVFVLFSIWVLGFMLTEQPFESLIGLGIVGVGALTYPFNRKR
jgi:APA family basic amino acid/polyamine antiporter